MSTFHPLFFCFACALPLSQLISPGPLHLRCSIGQSQECLHGLLRRWRFGVEDTFAADFPTEKKKRQLTPFWVKERNKKQNKLVNIDNCLMKGKFQDWTLEFDSNFCHKLVPFCFILAKLCFEHQAPCSAESKWRIRSASIVGNMACAVESVTGDIPLTKTSLSNKKLDIAGKLIWTLNLHHPTKASKINENHQSSSISAHLELLQRCFLLCCSGDTSMQKRWKSMISTLESCWNCRIRDYLRFVFQNVWSFKMLQHWWCPVHSPEMLLIKVYKRCHAIRGTVPLT